MSLRQDGWSILNAVVRQEDLFHDSRLGKLSSKMMVVVVAQLSTRCLLKEIKTYVHDKDVCLRVDVGCSTLDAGHARCSSKAEDQLYQQCDC